MTYIYPTAISKLFHQRVLFDQRKTDLDTALGVLESGPGAFHRSPAKDPGCSVGRSDGNQRLPSSFVI